MTIITNTYSNITEWTGSEIHLDNIDIGPHGDVYHGFAALKGDRWRHNRVGYAKAPFAKLYDDVESSATIPCSFDADAHDSDIYVSTTEGLLEDDDIYIFDKDGFEVRSISAVYEGEYITVSEPLDNSYSKDNNFSISKIVKIKINKNEKFTIELAGDWFEINNSEYYQIYRVDKTTGGDYYDIVETYYLRESHSAEDVLAIINTDATFWERDGKNPVINLHRKKFWDYGGQSIKSPEMCLSASSFKDEDNQNIDERNGAWLSTDLEDFDSQIQLLLSKDKEDIYNWSTQLGNNNSTRLNPIIRQSYFMERFNYEDAVELKKIWDEEGSVITSLDVTTDGVDGSCCMEIKYSAGTGEVWGLMPTSIDCEVLSETFGFSFLGDGENAVGTLYVDLLAADGTCVREDIEDIDLKDGGEWGSYSFDFSNFDGKRYLRAVVFGITSLGTGTVYIDNVYPFKPMDWNEIIADPTVVAGSGTEGAGLFACYYTARERPRQNLTVTATTTGYTHHLIQVADTSDFDEGDIVVLYDRDNYEMGIIDSVDSGTELTVNHIGAYSGDTSSEFQYDYDVDKQAMIANNTFRVNKIGASYIYEKEENAQGFEYVDISKWAKYPTNETSRPIILPGDPDEWDGLSVSQPSIKLENNKIYLAYSGCCLTNEPSIGIAESTNFVDFTKCVNNPVVLSCDADFDSDGCFHPDLIIKGQKSIIHYTGYNGTKRNIGSAYYKNDFDLSYAEFHVAMLVFPVGYKDDDEDYKGLPTETRTLYDQGNFRIDVDNNFLLSATARVMGDEITAKDSKEYRTLDNCFGTSLIHNHWNLVIGQYKRGLVSVHNVKLCPKLNQISTQHFTRSPWRLTEDLEPGDLTITVAGVCDAYDAPIADQDYMLFGKILKPDPLVPDTYIKGDDDFFQIGRIVADGVCDHGDGTYTLTLDYPIGVWGFSSENNQNQTAYGNQGIMLAQGATESDLKDLSDFVGYDIYAPSPSEDDNNIFDNFEVASKDVEEGSEGRWIEGYWIGRPGTDEEGKKISEAEYNNLSLNNAINYSVHVTGYMIDYPLLDPDYSRIPTLGNSQNLKKGWDFGFIGYADIASDWIGYYQNLAAGIGGRINLYSQMLKDDVDNPNVNPLPQWHEFDLSLIGALPDLNHPIAAWDMGDWDGDKIPDLVDSTDGNHLYLFEALTCDVGYIDGTIYMDNKENDVATTQYFTKEFTKLNSGDAQFTENVSGNWDDFEVEGSHLFKFNDQYYLAYTGRGKVAYPDSGSIIGDLYETSRDVDDISVDGNFFIPNGCCVVLELNFNKITNWIGVWANTTVGDVSLSDTFSFADYLAQIGTDYKYNLRWKLSLYANDTNDASPIIKSWEVSYDDTYEGISDEFMDAQNGVTKRLPANKIIHYNSSRVGESDERVDLTDLEPIIRNISYNIPMEPDRIGQIVASDVSIEFQNIDKDGTRFYFTENNVASPFYNNYNNRLYMNDEFIIYSGFKTDSYPNGEFEVTGRFKINSIDITHDGGAVIYCRSILRTALDTIIGKPVDGIDNPVDTFYDNVDVTAKDLMESILKESEDPDGSIIGAGIDSSEVFISDVPDRIFSHLSINNMTVGSALQKIAQACNGLVYTDNQGNIYFKTFDDLSTGTFEFSLGTTVIDTNIEKFNYVGQNFDSIVKSVNVIGNDLQQVQYYDESETLMTANIGRDIEIRNNWIQKNEWAQDIAELIIDSYGAYESKITLDSIYLPSVKLLDTVLFTAPSACLSAKEYLVTSVTKNVSSFSEKYTLTSNFAVEAE